MKTKKTLLAAALSTGLFSAASAHAVLTLSDGDMTVYDSDLNIYWLRDANLAKTNTFGLATGVDLGPIAGVNTIGDSYIGGAAFMSWGGAQHWINAMNAANYLGYNDWRLPTTLQPDVSCGSQSGGISDGYNCSGSEMGHLFYNELGGTAGIYDLRTERAFFTNVMSWGYWSGTEYAPDTNNAWLFQMWDGKQLVDYKGEGFFAWAVRDGDSPGVTSPVPEPETYAMLLGGLGLLGFVVRRRKQSA